MKGPGHDDLVAGPTDRQRQRLVAVRRPTDREPAPVRAPVLGRASLGVSQRSGSEPHRVQAPEQRNVTVDDGPSQVRALLVARDREGSRTTRGNVIRDSAATLASRGASSASRLGSPDSVMA